METENKCDKLTDKSTLRSWRTIECSQLAAWSTNRSQLAATRAMTYTGGHTISGSILSKAVHMEGCLIGCQWLFHFALRKCSGQPLALSRVHTILHFHPCHHEADNDHYQQQILLLSLTCPPSTYRSGASDIILMHLWQLCNNNTLTA